MASLEETLRAVASQRLLKSFRQIPTPKSLYARSDLLDLFNFVSNYTIETPLYEFTKFYRFQCNSMAEDMDRCPNLLFLIDSSSEAMKTLASIVLRNEFKGVTKRYVVYMWPHICYYALKELEKLNVAEKVEVRQYDIGIIPLRTGLFTQQMPIMMTECEQVRQASDGLLRMTHITGKFKAIVAKGTVSKKIVESLSYQIECAEKQEPFPENNDSLIVLDRSIDYVSPMLTGFTYEALLDKVFGIYLNTVDVPGNLIESAQPTERMLLDPSVDQTYSQIAFMDIHELSSFLQKKSDATKAEISRAKETAKDLIDLKSLNETLMVQYGKLQNHRSIVIHLLSQMEHTKFMNSVKIETDLVQQGSINITELQYLSMWLQFEDIARFIVLMTQTSEEKQPYSKKEKEIVQLLTNSFDTTAYSKVYNLRISEMVLDERTRSSWSELCKIFSLLPQEQGHSYSHVNLIYAPLIVRLVELILQGNLDPQMSNRIVRSSFQIGTVPKLKHKPDVYVYVSGGVTYSEISAFELMAKSKGVKLHLIGSCIRSGKDIVKEVAQFRKRQ